MASFGTIGFTRPGTIAMNVRAITTPANSGSITTSPIRQRAVAPAPNNLGTDVRTLFAKGVGVTNTSTSGANLGTVLVPAATTATLTGTLSGNVKIGTTVVPYCMVHLYYRQTGLLVQSVRADFAGAFTFYNLDTTLASDTSYFAVAVDPNGLATQWFSRVYDRLIPS